MKYFVYGLIVLLGVLHHDSWWWDDSDTLVFGFIPIGLAYHALISIAAGVLWGMAAKYCWPAEVDVVETSGGAGGSPRGDHA